MSSPHTEWQLWAKVHAIRRRHGEKVWIFVAEQIGMLLLAGDESGARFWRDIEDRLRKLSRGGSLH